MRSFSQGKSIPTSAPPDCDVALGLNMSPQPGGSNGGGGSYFRYDTSGNSVVLPRNFEFDDGYLRAFGGSEMMEGAEKGVFTSSQRQELEKQTLIHKYIMASVPVPPQLLFTPSPSQLPPVVSHSQSNTVSGGLDLLRFSSSGSDPEPWRCRRTDGKKWRCSRDVAPDQKYCDRHAHKTRPRSRKPVELSSPASSYVNNNNNFSPPSRQHLHQLIQTSSSRLEFKNDKHDLESSIGIGSVILGSQMAPPHPPSVTSSSKLSASSLSLSMPGENGIIDEDNDVENVYNSNRYNYNPWVQPGGPLGEALFLGNASVTGGGSNEYTSGGSDGFNFIG